MQMWVHYEDCCSEGWDPAEMQSGWYATGEEWTLLFFCEWVKWHMDNYYSSLKHDCDGPANPLSEEAREIAAQFMGVIDDNIEAVKQRHS